MFRNNLKVAWRNLKSNRLFSIINIVGLSIGLTIVMLLFLFISYERSFDSMFPKKDRIQRVLLKTNGDFGFETWATVPPVKSIERSGPPFIIKDAIPAIISAIDSKEVNFCLLIKLIFVFDNNRILNTQTFKRFTLRKKHEN